LFVESGANSAEFSLKDISCPWSAKARIGVNKNSSFSVIVIIKEPTKDMIIIIIDTIFLLYSFLVVFDIKTIVRPCHY
jgi:hypothetical protein